MSVLRRIRLIAWALVAIAGVGFGYLAYGPGPAPQRTDIRAAFGGPFSIADVEGRRVTERDLVGRPSLLFFGFTHCPDVCPTTLFDIAEWLDALGERGNELAVYLVTVDPERDTPALLRDYLAAFDGRIVGLVGTQDETKRIADSWRVLYRKVPDDKGGYTMDHTASIFMVGRDGRFAGTIDFHEDRAVALRKLEALLATGAPAS